MRKNSEKFFILFLSVLLLLAFPRTAFANSAEPPGLIILVPNAPKDLTVTLEIPGASGEVRVTETTKLWEQYFRLYYHKIYREVGENMQQAMLRVESMEKSFTCELPSWVLSDYPYNTLLTLNYEEEILTVGQPVWREPVLIALRVMLTLLLEGAVFWIFGFRNKHSWVVFIITNLLTQGWLNLVIAGGDFVSGYMILGFIGCEFLIFVVEGIGMTLLLKEQKRYRRLIYALIANGVSLGLGILILNYIPI